MLAVHEQRACLQLAARACHTCLAYEDGIC